MHRILVVVITLVLAIPALAAEPIVITDLLRVRSASSIDLSRDATLAVIAVNSIGEIPPDDSATSDTPVAERRFVNQSHLFLLDLSDPPQSPRQLTRGDRFDHQPVFSPDGAHVAFVRGRQDESSADPRSTQAPQVWVMPVDGGEAWPVTDLPEGADSPQWSPDGATLLVTGAVMVSDMKGTPPWPQERPKRRWGDVTPDGAILPRPDGSRDALRAWLEQNARRQDPAVISRLEFQDEQSLKGPMKLSQLWLVDPDRGPSSATRISRRFHDYRNARILPDGNWIVYAATPDDGRHPDRILESNLWRLKIDGTEDTELLALPGWRLESPRPSQDGSVIAFIAQQMDEPMYRQERLGLAAIGAAGASEPTWLTDEETFDASVRSIEWLPARSSLLFSTARRGGFPLLHTSFGLLEPAALVEEINGQPAGVHAFGAAGNTIVYALTGVENPCVLRVRDARGDRLLLDLNAWVADKELSTPVAGWITRPDGLQVQYWLMEPARREPGKTYPLAVEIHGGPSAMWGPGEFSMWHEFQLLASWGYGVVYANPRGSGGYGYEFQKGNHQNWSFGPASDVLAVVDQVLLKEWIDPEQLVLTGGSYGGYLTAFVISQDHRFKAAVAQRGVYDFSTFFGEGNAWRLVEWAMGGWPWQPLIRPILQRESPFSYVSRIRTPLLILHASEDLRTGVSQSQMFYRALKQMERPVEYVRYPGAGHDLSRTGDPMQRLDRLGRILEFFERHIHNERPAPIAADSAW